MRFCRAEKAGFEGTVTAATFLRIWGERSAVRRGHDERTAPGRGSIRHREDLAGRVGRGVKSTFRHHAVKVGRSV